MSLSPEHLVFLVERGITPATAQKYGLYSSNGSIAIPIGGAVKLYTPDGSPKMRWDTRVNPPVPPFPSFDAARHCTVWVEGELDAILASQELGIEVGSTTLGANGWMDEWSDTISSGGHPITLLYDNDEPGEKGALKAAESLRKYGVRVQIAKWPKDKEKGYDITEHFRERGSVDDLRAILDLAQEVIPPGLALRADEFLSVERGSAGHLVADIWPAASVGFISGEPKTFKSFAATELAFAVASGKPFLGRHEVVQRGRVLIIQQESSWPAFQGRVRAASKRYGMPEDLHILSNHGLLIQSDSDAEKIEAEVARLRPILVVLDPLRSFVVEGENSNDEMGKVVRFLRKLRDNYGTAVCVVHHANKSRDTGRGGMKMSGAGALYAATEASLYLNRTEDESANISWVNPELKESGAAPSFQIHLEPSTCLLNVISPGQALKNTVRGINDDLKKAREPYWNQSELSMVDSEIPF